MTRLDRSSMVCLLVLASSIIAAGAARAEEHSPQPVASAPQIQIDHQVGAARELSLEVGQNRLLVLSEQIVRVSVAEPRIADLKVITPTQLLLTARGVGATDLTVWNKKDEPLVMALQVTRNLDALRRQLRDLFRGEQLTVQAAGELVVLSGETSDLRLPERAAELARLHSEKVVNLIKVRGNQQVQLEVKFAEVQRRGLREMSFNLLHQDHLGRFVTGMTGSATSPGALVGVPGADTNFVRPPTYAAGSRDAFSLFFSGLTRFPFSLMVSLLEQSGLAKVLAEPTLVAMSGQEAKFLAGGEFAIPYSTGLGMVTVLWKKFGIVLSFTPTVIDQSTINLKLSAEVSDIDPSRSVTVGGFVVPGLISRQSETTVRLGDGQSFAIAGLLSNQVRSTIDKVPLFGDLPILGALFRSVTYRRDESELLVVVTAHLARPVAPHEAPALPTDYEMNDPSDFALFMLGSEGQHVSRGEKQRQPAGEAKDDRRAMMERRGPAGDIGFQR